MIVQESGELRGFFLRWWQLQLGAPKIELNTIGRSIFPYLNRRVVEVRKKLIVVLLG